VTVVEVAALGKPIEIHDKDEVGDLNPALPPTREVAMGDQQAEGDSEKGQTAPPTLRKPGESAPSGSSNKVQFPTASQPATPSTSSTAPPLMGQPLSPPMP
jgi:hypothetical protein